MFSSFDSTQTPAVKVWNYSATLPSFTESNIALEDDCAPFQYFVLGGSTGLVNLSLPSSPAAGKQITIKADVLGSALNIQKIAIYTAGYLIGTIGISQTITYAYVPQAAGTGKSTNFINALCWVQVVGGSAAVNNTGAVVTGGIGNSATSSQSIVGAGQNNTASGGYSSVLSGNGNSANTTYTVVLNGNNNTASGTYASVVNGSFNVASGTFSSITGGNNSTADGPYSTIVGGSYGSTKTISGICVIPASNSPIVQSVGSTQTTILNLGVKTTTAAATVLRSNTSSASALNQLALVYDAASTFQGQVTAVAKLAIATTAASGDGTTATLTFAAQTAAPFIVGQKISVSGVTPSGYNTGTGTVTACTTTTVSYTNSTTGAQTVAGTITATSWTSAWAFTGAIQQSNTVGAIRLVGTPSINLLAQDPGASGWAVALTADTTNGALAVTVTGAAGISIYWLCTLFTTEVLAR